MKPGFTRLAHRITRIEARLDALGDGRQVRIPARSGMFGLRTAIEAVRKDWEARGVAKWTPEVGQQPLGPVARLRAALLAEQAWRKANAATLYADTEAIYDIEEADQ